MRTHSLVQSSPLLAQVIEQTPIHTDVSLFLPHCPDLRPVEYYWGNKMLLRLPYFWEDDFEMERPAPLWSHTAILKGRGIKIFDFHPIHIYLNSANMHPYNQFKASVRSLQDATAQQAAPFVADGVGSRTMFIALLKQLSATQESMRICDVYAKWKTHKE